MAVPPEGDPINFEPKHLAAAHDLADRTPVPHADAGDKKFNSRPVAPTRSASLADDAGEVFCGSSLRRPDGSGCAGEVRREGVAQGVDVHDAVPDGGVRALYRQKAAAPGLSLKAVRHGSSRGLGSRTHASGHRS
jgi:hypothetical protein